MKHIFILGLFFLLSVTTLVAGDPDVSRNLRKKYNYGERILRMDYAGDSTFKTYLLISCDSNSHNVRKSGTGFEVLHPNVGSKDTGLVWSFIGNGKSYIKNALRTKTHSKTHFTIVLTQNKYGDHDGWRYIKDGEVSLY